MTSIGTRLRAVFTGVFGGLGSSVSPWHLPRGERAPLQVNERTALTLTTVYRACSLLADAVTNSPIQLYSRPQSGGRVIDSTSAAARALALVTHADLELAAHSCALGGNGFLRIFRDGTGAPSELRAVPPYLVSVEIEENTRAVWYRVLADPITGEPEALVPEADMVHCKYRAVANRIMGVAPMQSCAPSFALALQSRNVQRYLYTNLSSPGGYLFAPGKIEKNVARTMQAEWEANYSGDGVGRTAVLTNGLEYKPLLFKAADQLLLDQVQSSVQDIARAYGVPRQFLEDTHTMSYASAAEGGKALVSLALRGFTARIADALSLKLISRNDRANGASVAFDLSEMLMLPGKELSDFLGGLVTQGVITPNEARNNWLRLPDAPGGGALRVPPGSQHADQQPQGARAWERGYAYPIGSFVCHDSGLWQRSEAGFDDEEPCPESAAWDCISPGVKSIETENGKLVFVMSSGHRKTVEGTNI